MFAANVFHSKVINYEGEMDWSGVVFPEARGVAAWPVAMFGQSFGQKFLCNHSGLWKSIHSTANFHVDFTIVDLVHEVVFIDDFLWDHLDGQEHVLVSFHGCTQVEILDVNAHEFCMWCGDYAVEGHFGSGEICDFGADIAGVID